LKKITLTFDNGPDPDVTPLVLDILARHDIKATFFVIGDKLREPRRRKLAERAHSEGHRIGNHTFNHITPLGLSRYKDAADLEIGETQALIGDLAHPSKLFRPFGGGGHLNRALLNAASLEYLQREKFSCVLWNTVPRDWEDPDGWVEVALQQCAATDWPLVVLHDFNTRGMQRLDRFITLMMEQGGRFVQDYPPDCVPVVDGKIVRSMADYVA
jgi:peptidoglycan/xylan/chitin deacetylase (PgdA/CDA1 family)